MIQLLCDHCKKKIDPQSDNLFDLPQLTVKVGSKMGRINNLHMCSKACLLSWLEKNSEPSNIITAQNPLGPAS